MLGDKALAAVDDADGEAAPEPPAAVLLVRARSRPPRATRTSTAGIEVYNVEGAGGTLGLSELVSKDSGDPYELMMTGLVMLGAI